MQIYIDDIDINGIRVELYADGENGHQAIRQEMKRKRELVGSVNGYDYQTTVPSKRPISDYTVRIIPYFSDVSIPLEANNILWQR